MLRSMTAYSRVSINAAVGRLTIEMHSVNRKQLEMTVNMPKELRRFEPELRKSIAEKLVSGQVTVNIYMQFENAAPVVVTPNLHLAKEFYAGWLKIAANLQLPPQAVDLTLLASQEGIFVYQEEISHDDEYREALLKGLQQAVATLVAMREEEGAVLGEELCKRVNFLSSFIQTIEEKSMDLPQKQREKLTNRLEELLPISAENEERVLREIILYAEKVDVTEEITRFRSHLQQLSTLLKGRVGGVGKEMDFILQELNREINTLGSKSPDLEVSHLVVKVKAELAKIREQVQNIE